MPVKVNFRQLITVLLPLLLILGACAPQTQTVANTVLPTIFSIKVEGDTLLIQGRYLGAGEGGYEAGNYVLVGADMMGVGGRAYQPSSWSNSRLEVTIAANDPGRTVYVSVDGQLSNVLPFNRD